MVLKGKGCFFGMRTVRRAFEPASGAGQLDIVLDQHAVVQNGDARGREEFAGVIKNWDQLKTTELDALNRQLSGAGLPALQIEQRPKTTQGEGEEE